MRVKIKYPQTYSIRVGTYTIFVYSLKIKTKYLNVTVKVSNVSDKRPTRHRYEALRIKIKYRRIILLSLKFLKKIKNNTNCKMFVVGDISASESTRNLRHEVMRVKIKYKHIIPTNTSFKMIKNRKQEKKYE